MTTLLLLQYHQVSPDFAWSGTRVTPRQLERHVRELKEMGYEQLGPEELLSLGEEMRRHQGRHVLFTFDDGLEGIYTYAYPILERWGYRGLVSVVAGYIGREARWDASFGLPGRHLNRSQLLELHRAGWLIGSHTLTHPDLRRLREEELMQELRVSKEVLEDLLGEEVLLLTYPYGLYNDRVEHAAIQAGYRVALTSCGRAGRITLPRRAVYLLDLSIRPKTEEFFLLRWAEELKEKTIQRFSHLSALARHRFRWMARVAGMDTGSTSLPRKVPYDRE